MQTRIIIPSMGIRLCVFFLCSLVRSKSFEKVATLRSNGYRLASPQEYCNLPNNVCSFLNSTVLSVLYSATNVVVLGRFL